MFNWKRDSNTMGVILLYAFLFQQKTIWKLKMIRILSCVMISLERLTSNCKNCLSKAWNLPCQSKILLWDENACAYCSELSQMLSIGQTHFSMIFISKRMDIYGFKLPSLVVLAFEARKSFLLSLFVLLLCHSHPPIKAPARVVYMCSNLL